MAENKDKQKTKEQARDRLKNLAPEIEAKPDFIEEFFTRWSRYQCYYCFLFFICKVPLAWQMLSNIFLYPPMNFYCNSGDLNACPCKNPTWDTSIFTSTVPSTYGLICDRQWLSSITAGLFGVGLLIGALFYGAVADAFGRLRSFLLSVLLLLIASVAVSFMPEIISYSIARVAQGIACGGFMITHFVLLVEHCGTNHRELVVALWHIPFNLGHVTLPGFAYFLRDWKWFHLSISLPLFLLLFYQCIANESPKWLIAQGKTERAIAVLEKICKFNRRPYDDIRRRVIASVPAQATTSSADDKPKKNVLITLLKNRRLMTNLLCMSLNYFACGLCYYGMAQYIGRMSGDIFVNVALTGIFLVPSTLTCTVLLMFVGRKPMLICSNIISGSMFVAVAFLNEDQQTLKIVLAVIGTCTIFISFIIVFLYGVELFPTVVRNAALGFLSALSRLGMILGPIINELPQMVACLTYGLIPIAGAVLVLFLPETKGKPLTSQIE